jgi:uncharacterized protein (TIGR02453 family)
MSFRGFGADALPFLKALAFHQTREWFEANKATYEADLRMPMGDLVEDLATTFAKAKIPLKGDRKSSLFRIHRDVRFSKDTDPYKTNVGAVMTRSGGKNDPGLLYVHISVEGCFTAAGFYDPAPETLARLRGAMTRTPKAWKQAVAKLAKSGLAPSDEYALKRNPRGFEDVADPDIVAGLRLKSFIVRRPLEDKRLAGAALVGEIAAFAKDALPLLKWGWDAIADARSA